MAKQSDDSKKSTGKTDKPSTGGKAGTTPAKGDGKKGGDMKSGTKAGGSKSSDAKGGKK